MSTNLLAATLSQTDRALLASSLMAYANIGKATPAEASAFLAIGLEVPFNALAANRVKPVVERRNVCKHGRRKHRCKDCGGSSICPHGREQHVCKDCGGSGLCHHGRRKCRCAQCGGSSLCQHGRERFRCKLCGGMGVCPHGQQRQHCAKCPSKGSKRVPPSGQAMSAGTGQEQGPAKKPKTTGTKTEAQGIQATLTTLPNAGLEALQQFHVSRRSVPTAPAPTSRGISGSGVEIQMPPPVAQLTQVNRSYLDGINLFRDPVPSPSGFPLHFITPPLQTRRITSCFDV
jgi:hypothetical protein